MEIEQCGYRQKHSLYMALCFRIQSQPRRLSDNFGIL
jgi:hypothetical protein